MKLSELVREFPFSHTPLTGDVDIAGIVSDSRLVQPGYIFVALAGGTTDGHLYIPAALERGAVAVVGMHPLGHLEVP